MVIYVTKGKGPEIQRGKGVGILETNGKSGHISRFLPGDTWAEKGSDPKSRGKWEYAVGVSRARPKGRGVLYLWISATSAVPCGLTKP